jgi:replicative DNA helicase
MAAVKAFPAPPHSIDAEQALIGAVLLDHRAWSKVQVRPEDFYRPEHRAIVAAFQALSDRGQAPDAVATVAYLRGAGMLAEAGGQDYIAQLLEQTTSSANVATYARIVREHAQLRDLREVGLSIIASAEGAGQAPVSERVSEAMRQLLSLAETARTGRGLVAAKDLVPELLDDLDRRREGARGLQIGLRDFDSLSNGLEPGDLIVIAGRPGMGKTALLVTIAAHVSRQTGVAIFSAEMAAHQLMRRAVSLLGSVSQGKLRTAQALASDEWDRIGEAANQLAARRLWIDDTPSPSLTHVRSEVLSLKARAPLGLVLVDYVQLIQGHGANRYEQLRDVAYGLKGLAKEANAPVILLAQLNRGVESRDRKKGRLSDLRDSGAIEEAADIVAMLYSEGYYNPDFGMPYVLECQVEKNRNGERGECLWHFSGEHSRVGTLEEGAREQYRRLRAQLVKPRTQPDDDL